MTEKRFMVDDAGTLIDMETRNTYDYVSDVCDLLNDLNNENKELKRNLTSYQNMVEQYINLHIDKIRRIYVNPTREEVAERTRIIRDLEQLKKELI